jgi:selenocysteine lyase/cysteine desulfurase
MRAVRSCDGHLPVDEMVQCINDRTRVVTASTVTFAPGFRTDIDRLGRACRERGVFFLVDAAGNPGPHLAHIVAVGELGAGDHYGADDERLNKLYTFLIEHAVRLSVSRGVLRFWLHVYNTVKDVERVLNLTQRWLRG